MYGITWAHLCKEMWVFVLETNNPEVCKRSRAWARCWGTALQRSSPSGCRVTSVKTSCSSYWTLIKGENIAEHAVKVLLALSFPDVCSSVSRKNLTLKYYAKKILYFLRQQNILRSLKSFLEQPAEQQLALEGTVELVHFDCKFI